MTDDQILQDAFENLFKKIDWLGIQLDRSLKNITKKQFYEISKDYRIPVEMDREEMKTRMWVLLRYLPAELVDADHLSMMLWCDMELADELLAEMEEEVK